MGPRSPALVAAPDPTAGLDTLERLAALAAQLAETTGEPPPRSVSRAAYRLLRDRLGALKKSPGGPPAQASAMQEIPGRGDPARSGCSPRYSKSG